MKPVTALFLIASVFVFCFCSPRVEKEISPSAAVVEHEEHKKIVLILEKGFLFNNYTLDDVYPYKDTTREFQWSKIRERLILLDSIQQEPARWGILQNRRNINGEAPLTKLYGMNTYGRVADIFGVERYQSVPLYPLDDSITPVRYGRDGSLVKVLNTGDSAGFVMAHHIDFNDTWLVPGRYMRLISDSTVFVHAVFVDRSNQNIATVEKVDSVWFVRSMNPATTGLHNPPYMKETPLGMFVVQEKKSRMVYLEDGSPATGGFAPYASRFSNGGYIHGIPVNAPGTGLIEFSPSLGTTPRSHMCVRNATSHAKFVYDHFPTEKTIIFVFD